MLRINEEGTEISIFITIDLLNKWLQQTTTALSRKYAVEKVPDENILFKSEDFGTLMNLIEDYFSNCNAWFAPKLVEGTSYYIGTIPEWSSEKVVGFTIVLDESYTSDKLERLSKVFEVSIRNGVLNRWLTRNTSVAEREINVSADEETRLRSFLYNMKPIERSLDWF